MTWNQIDWTVVGSQSAGIAVILSAGWKWLKKKEPKLVSEIPHGVAKVIDDGVNWVEDLAKTPWFASAAATGKLELKHVTDKLLVSHLGQAASQALASFGKALGNMSESEKGTAVEMTQAALKALGQEVTAAQALNALQVADTEIAKLSAIAQAATERSQALKPAPAAPAQPVENATQIA